MISNENTLKTLAILFIIINFAYSMGGGPYHIILSEEERREEMLTIGQRDWNARSTHIILLEEHIIELTNAKCYVL